MASILRTLGVAVAALSCLTPSAALAQQASVRAGEVWFEALSPQHLDAGRCGLFLWAHADQPLFVLAAFDVPNAAYVRANGRERALQRTGFAGERVHGQFEQQTFSDGRLTLNVDLEFDNERPLRDGAVVQQGVMRVMDGEGWETIMPVGGMVACRA